MNSVRVYHYDAFSTEPNKGNPAEGERIGPVQ